MKKLFLILTLFPLVNISYTQPIHESIIEMNDIIYEKIYLHIDREVYSPRENIWFRIFIVSGIDNKLLSGFKNVYVELINKKGEVVDHRLILTHNGSGLGDFQLPYYIEEGQYVLRAYTKYQKNFGEESYFHKKIQIITIKQEVEKKNKDLDKCIDVGFFPESGNMVMNTINNIAFKSVDVSGRGISVSGHVLSDLGDTITSFTSAFKGMGSFMLFPETGRSYLAVLDGYPEYVYQFENIFEEGVSMHILDESNSLKLKLYRNLKHIKQDVVLCTVNYKGIDILTEPVELEGFIDEYSISKSRFPLGISKITLTDTEGRVLAERIVFIQNGFENLVDIQLDKNIYTTREKVKLDLLSLLPPEDTIRNGISVAVVNRDYLNRNGYNMDIRSYLLLDSELKGPIESSASFFSDEEISVSEKLNLLMMVQGWRSYYWPDILAKQSENLKGWEDIGLTVSGFVKKPFSNDPVKDGRVIIGPFSSKFLMLDTVTNSIGRFQFDRLYLRDSTTLIIEARNARGKVNTEVSVLPMYHPNLTANISVIENIAYDQYIPFSFYGRSYEKLTADLDFARKTNEVWIEDVEKMIDERYAYGAGTQWIDEVVVNNNIKFKFSDFLKTKFEILYGKPDTSIIVRDVEERYLDVFNYLKANPIPGVNVKGKEITIRNGRNPLYLINDKIKPPNLIEELPFINIDEIRILKKGSNDETSNGVIALYTKKSSIEENWTPQENRYVKGRSILKVDGFQPAGAFYSPKYTLENIEKEIPDYRPTLFWEPFVFFQDRHSELEFFTSDFISDYIVIVEGISKSGKICIGTKLLLVK